MVEPTETEDLDTLDHFVEVMEELVELAKTDPEKLKKAPVSTPVGRLDEVKAARDMRLSYA
jgi:glycine dehydrogenase subunit 2